MKYLRYYSGFYSRDNIPYRIEIWQDAEAAFDPERITLAADPVEIEWAEVDKLEPVHSSSATLNSKYPLIPTLWMIFEDSTFAFRSGDKHRSRRIYGK